MSSKVQITETILRDAHQSLVATRMSTDDMLPIVEKLDQVGYFSLEMWGGATFDVCLRYLNEDPWERLRAIKQRVKNTKLQMLLRGQNLVGYRHYPDDIVIKFVEKAKENGIDVFRIFDAVNDSRNMAVAIKAAKKVGALVEGAISYTVSPVHTIEKYIKFAYELKELGCDIICIKDMAGFISPVAAYDLTNALKKEVGIPVHLHAHCSSGMAPVVYLTACEAGADILDTAISPFSWGTSQPPTETIVGALKGTPYDTSLDLELLTEIGEYFQKVKEKYKGILDPISERVDPKILLHQIPGGMLSNLISQLKEQKAMDKYGAVLKETAHVRKDLGYPPLVTPTSQIVGTQAVLNVVLGERYKVIPKEVKDYIKGLYGRSPGPIDLEVKKRAIGDEEPIKGRPADALAPEFEKCCEAIKEHSDRVEDILSYALFPQVAEEFFKNRTLGVRPAREPVVLAQQRDQSASPHARLDPLGREGSAHPNFIQMLKGNVPDEFIVKVGDKKYQVNIAQAPPKGKTRSFYIDLNGKPYEVELERRDKVTASPIPQPAAPEISKTTPPSPSVPAQPPKVVEKAPPLEGLGINVKVPMPGKIISVKVKTGDRVKKGDMLLVLEAMKMQNEIDAPQGGIVSEVNVKPGDNVDNNTVVMRINPS